MLILDVMNIINPSAEFKTKLHISRMKRPHMFKIEYMSVLIGVYNVKSKRDVGKLRSLEKTVNTWLNEAWFIQELNK